MKILNIMLSRGLGGIQQAFLDYDKALRFQEITVINVTSYKAQINSLSSFSTPSFKLPNFAPVDFLSVLVLKYIIYKTRPDIIIAHGNRAINFSKFASQKNTKLVGIAHNYSLKGLRKCDYIIALTNHMKEFLLKNGFSQSKIFILPNMINLHKNSPTIDLFHNLTYKDEFEGNTEHGTAAYTLVRKDSSTGLAYKLPLEGSYEKGLIQPVMIGTFARFVPKKGVDIFIKAIHILKNENYAVKAIIGGEGEEKEKLLALTHKLNLQDQILFTGWVKDKEEFFKKIDIFCLPSLHEPFGIIVLEAMEQGVPIVSTNTEGPAEILTHMQDGLICTTGSAEDLAKKIIYLIKHPLKAKEFAQAAHLRLIKNYDISVVSKKLAQFCEMVKEV